jgi:hypothetical protein
MAHGKTVKNDAPGWQPSRRELLGAAAVAALGVLSRPGKGLSQSTRPAPSHPKVSPLVERPWWLGDEAGRSRVVDIRSGDVLHASVVDRVVLREMLDRGIQGLTDAPTAEEAWRTVLGSGERIVAKFNSVGAAVIGTNDSLAQVLVERLASAGYSPDKITLVEVPQFQTKQLGTESPARGWGADIPVGRGHEPLARYLYEADALINVSLLKTHQIAGMSACMKNLSHALIRHPARYHDHGCSPYVGQVVGSKQVSSRLKLNLVNALRVVVNRGPDARDEDLHGYGGLLLGFDPLAVDNVGLSVLETERRRLGQTARLRVPYLVSAAAMGLGCWRPPDIDRITLDMGD